MPMIFHSTDRPNNGIQTKLKNEDTPLTKIPFINKTEGSEQNFQEIMASERYKEVVDNVRHYLGPHYQGSISLNNRQSYNQFMSFMMRSHREILTIERPFREELSQLAIKIVMEEFKIPVDDVRWDVKIVSGDEIKMDEFNMDDDGIEIPQVDLSEEPNDFEKLNLERAKRRLINCLTQGASKKGHYSYHLVSEEVLNITKNEVLLDLYGVMMSINDTTYWQFDDDFLSMMGKGGQVAGTEEIEDGDPPIIKVRAQNFPVAVHECIKGYLELLSVHGRPKDENGDYDEVLWSKISEYEDTLDKEMWDLRLGPSIWNRFRNMLPDEVVIDENDEGLQAYFLTTLYTKDATEFLSIMKEVIGNTEKGKQLMDKHYNKIRKSLNQIDYEGSVYDLDDEDDE